MADTIFYNADYVVIEYLDLIKSPYLILLHQLLKNPKIGEILKIEEVQFNTDAALYEWYIQRKHQNFLIDLNRYPDQITEETLYNLLDSQINLAKEFYTHANLLPIGNSIAVIKNLKMSKDVIIYYPHDYTFAKEDLENLTHTEFTFMSDWDLVMKKCGANSTYFLSDIRKIDRMKKAGVLKFSSITLPVEYRYNKKNMEDFAIDFNELWKTDPFKLSYTQACSVRTSVEHLMQDN